MGWNEGRLTLHHPSKRLLDPLQRVGQCLRSEKGLALRRHHPKNRVNSEHRCSKYTDLCSSFATRLPESSSYKHRFGNSSLGIWPAQQKRAKDSDLRGSPSEGVNHVILQESSQLAGLTRYSELPISFLSLLLKYEQTIKVFQISEDIIWLLLNITRYYTTKKEREIKEILRVRKRIAEIKNSKVIK